MKRDIHILRQYEKDGWIRSQTHPSLPLIIWNYTNQTQYDAHWDKITLNCRGLVTDLDGKHVSKGFPKFFNYSENRTDIPETIDYVEVWEKMDGSYIGLFWYADQWIINSKGSFTSDQVIWASEILMRINLENLNKSWTYCFELIVPENRIVCDYGEERSLYFLSAFCNGLEIEEISPSEFIEGDIIEFPKLLQLNTFNPGKLREDAIDNKEGYVIKFKNGERCKIKFEEYLRLHRIVTNTTSYDIWELLRFNGDFQEIIDRVPDEFMTFVTDTKNDLERNFNNLKTEITSEFKTICLSLGQCDDKTFAKFIEGNEYKHYLFALRNNKSIDDQIWVKIKPVFQKPFQA